MASCFVVGVAIVASGSCWISKLLEVQEFFIQCKLDLPEFNVYFCCVFLCYLTLSFHSSPRGFVQWVAIVGTSDDWHLLIQQ